MYRRVQRAVCGAQEETARALMSKIAGIRALAHTAKITVATVVDAALGRFDHDTLDQRLVSWSHKMLDEAEITIVVRGRENLGDGSETFILMSNHQSHYDIPIIYRAIPGRIRMVAKAELFRIPLFGRAMRAGGVVEVNRSDRQQAMQNLRRSASMLDHGTHLWIAPEGTRSITGELGPFKSGGFHLALETGRRILPIAIDGTRRVLQSGTANLNKGEHVTVTILPPIDPRSFGPERRKDLSDAVKNAIASALPIV